jgi:hypothetical protein
MLAKTVSKLYGLLAVGLASATRHNEYFSFMSSRKCIDLKRILHAHRIGMVGYLLDNAIGQ